MAAALVPAHGVDLVDDHCLGLREHPPPRGRREQQVQGLGRRHQEVRRVRAQRRALRGRRVTRAQPDAKGGTVEGHRTCGGGDALERMLEVLRDVRGERTQRRDVHHTWPWRTRLARIVGMPRRVDRDEEAGEGLAGAGRRGDQHVAARRDLGPRAALRLGGAVGEPRGEPCGDGRVERAEWPLAWRHSRGQERGLADDGRHRAIPAGGRVTASAAASTPASWTGPVGSPRP